MASVHSNLERDFVRTLRYEWNLPSYWLGRTLNSEGDWTWTDGTLVDWTSWYDRQPNGDGHSRRTSAGTAAWYDERCVGYPEKICL